MPVIGFQKLNQHLRNTDKPLNSLWLVHGEEFLCTQALDAILAALLPDPKDRMNYEPVGHADNQVVVALEKINTYSFIAGSKVVAMLDCRVFDSPKTTSNLILKVQTAIGDDDLKKAGPQFIRLLSALNLSLDDVTGDSVTGKSRRQLLKLSAEDDGGWLNPVLDYCRQNGLTVPQNKAPAQMMEDAISQGFPENHHLIINTDLIDRRRRLYKVIEANGIVVDCVVPQGSRKAEKDIQTSVLKERMAAILKDHGKQMDPIAFQALYAKTGFQLRVFCGNLEKLVDYVGKRKQIGPADVETVLNRSRVDPVFELTGAISERDLGNALFYLKTMQAQDLHPLQIIAALSNQVRKLIIARDFIASSHGRAWNVKIGFNDFKRRVMPAIHSYDDELSQMLSDWKRAFEEPMPQDKDKPPPKGRKKRVRNRRPRDFTWLLETPTPIPSTNSSGMPANSV